jgi:tripartite-type tricarboxylate transporter receptor subunit TctC
LISQAASPSLVRQVWFWFAKPGSLSLASQDTGDALTLHRLVLFVSLVLSPFSVATGAAAQYQSDPIAPQAAGRSMDTLTRVLAAALSNELHQQVVVDDRPRGALTLGLDLAAKMPPDGDFQPIAVVSRGQLPLAVSPKTPFHSMRELIDYAKQNPGKLLNASSSNGSPGHVGGELFKFTRRSCMCDTKAARRRSTTSLPGACR